MRTPKQALVELEKGQIWPIYYLYGEEPFKIQEFISRMTTIVFGSARPELHEFRVDRIDGATATGSDVLEAVQSVGLFGRNISPDARRLVLVNRSHALKDVDPLAHALVSLKVGEGDEAPWGTNVLVCAAETLDGRRKFHQWLKKTGYALEFKPARDAELSQWVHYLAKRWGSTVAPEAVDLLSVICQGSLHRLDQEIGKAWAFAGAVPGVQILPTHVVATGSPERAYEMIELVNAILDGKRARALLLCAKLIVGPEEALGLVGFLTWSIKQAGMRPGVNRNGTRSASTWIAALVDLDDRLKSSGSDPRILIEQFVIEQTPIPNTR